ncbi:Autophagy-related protein 9 [Cladophialophora carrionii]|uniref:Autophagy-related protein 9 n=1 Tax=Cladophialophora carrionii TaxID=86049 RepID=A0A1C1CWY6_9EURO|nr:Autophagy-related protein 9 [Cladophialophora carrionii]
MASNFMSRLMSSNNPSASIYETLREQDEDSEGLDVEETAAMAPEGGNRRDSFTDRASIDFGAQRHRKDVPPPSQRATRGQAHNQMPRKDKSRMQNRSRRHGRHSKLLGVEEADDDVPASLLIDHHAQDIDPDSITLPPPPSSMPDGLPRRDDTGPSSIPRGTDMRRRPDLHPSSQNPSRAQPVSGIVGGNLASADPKEKAMFRWVNVTDLDNFLLEVYTYYLHHGFWSTLLMRFFNLLNVAFIVGFSIFLTQCIDYREIRGSTKMSEILVPQCTRRMGFIPNALLWCTTFVWLWKGVLYLFDIPRLYHMHDFYFYLLDIPEQEIQSISWQEVVSRLMALRDSNPTITSRSTRAGAFVRTQDKQRMDAHDIANRLMRRQNYMIAMINKDILDLTLPIPYLRHRKLFTRTLEWNIDLCIMDFVFNRKGQVRPLFLKDTHRKDLANALRSRFIIAGITSLAFAPFLATFFVLRHFFQNFNDYQKNPAQIGMRDYTPFAQWKFREFNELHHLFRRRINMSYPFADRYINQFPKDKTVQIARFVSLISGAVVSVLGLATILDQDNFLNFEVTPGRTTIFYIGIFGSIWAVARGLLPEDNMVYDTAFSIQEVIQFTHYEPNHWANRLHTVEVKEEFSQLYQMKVMIFLEEVLSIFFTPFVLWFSLPRCSERIIDFFREFTVHVDGIGYVCTFAEFSFMGQAIRPAPKERGAVNADGTTAATANNASANAKTNTNTNLRDDYFASKDNKLEHSYWGFMNDYARNPKTDIHFPYNSSRRRFNFPPPVPGLPSPSFPPHAEHPGHPQLHRHGSSGPLLGSLASPPPQRGTFGTPRFNAVAQNHGASQGHGAASPLQSLLLDPHHQPSASGFGPASPQALRPRGVGGLLAKPARRTGPGDRARGLHPDDVAEEEDQPPADLQAPTSTADRPVPPSQAQSSSAPDPPSQSHSGALGSWNYEVDSSSGADSEEENERDVRAIMAPMGPLGLIRQFQKAQAQERNGGLGRIGGEV